MGNRPRNHCGGVGRFVKIRRSAWAVDVVCRFVNTSWTSGVQSIQGVERMIKKGS